MFPTVLVVLLMGAVIDAAPREWQVLSGEYKSYRQIGDQVVAEYEKLHPDGSITRKEATGDITKGLTYNNYQIDPDGNMRLLDAPGFAPVDRLGPSGFSGYPRESGGGVARWKPEKPKLEDVKMSRNPMKDFFKDIFSW